MEREGRSYGGDDGNGNAQSGPSLAEQCEVCHTAPGTRFATRGHGKEPQGESTLTVLSLSSLK